MGWLRLVQYQDVVQINTVPEFALYVILRDVRTAKEKHVVCPVG